MEAHPYISQISEAVYQAIIYDGKEAHAKSMGVEYIVSEKLFKTLLQEEKKMAFSPL